MYEPYSKSDKTDDQIFAYVLMPHMLQFHSSIIHLCTSADGRIHDKEIYKLIKLLGKLQKFHFTIHLICSDGDSGLTRYQIEYFKKNIEKKLPLLFSEEHPISVFDLVKSLFGQSPKHPPLPTLDILHACKSARTRLINGPVCLNKEIDPLSPEEISMILDIGTTLTDLSSIGKMNDFYAINLFSLNNASKAFKSKNRQLFLYLLVYSFALEIFRNPYIYIETRKQLCYITILMFAKFYIQTPLITKKDDNCKTPNAQITQNKSKDSNGVNFGSAKYLMKMIHTMLAVRYVLEHNPEYLALDRLTTNIIENYFGQNRVQCRGNNSLNHVLHFFIHF